MQSLKVKSLKNGKTWCSSHIFVKKCKELLPLVFMIIKDLKIFFVNIILTIMWSKSWFLFASLFSTQNIRDDKPVARIVTKVDTIIFVYKYYANCLLCLNVTNFMIKLLCFAYSTVCYCLQVITRKWSGWRICQSCWFHFYPGQYTFQT